MSKIYLVNSAVAKAAKLVIKDACAVPAEVTENIKNGTWIEVEDCTGEKIPEALTYSIAAIALPMRAQL